MILLVTGGVHGFLNPDFGLNEKGIVCSCRLLVGIGFVTYFTEGTTTLLAIRRYHARSTVRLFGTAALVAAICVLASRLIDFHPGVVYGFVASSLIVAPVALSRRANALLALLPTLGLVAVSLIIWLALPSVVDAAAATDGWLLALPQTILRSLWPGWRAFSSACSAALHGRCGCDAVESACMGGCFGAATFLYWQLLLNQDHAYADAFRQTNVQVALLVLAIFMLVRAARGRSSGSDGATSLGTVVSSRRGPRSHDPCNLQAARMVSAAHQHFRPCLDAAGS